MPSRAKLLFNLATAGVTMLAVVVGGARLRQEFSANENRGPSGPRAIGEWKDYSRDGHRIGSVDAPVTIVEFADFQCPYCRAAWIDLQAIMDEFAGDVALIFRHFPLPSHLHAMSAARASECASAAGRFREFHDRLFQEADSIGQKPWTRYASDAGIMDSMRFSQCVRDTGAVEAIGRDRRLAAKLGVEGTPTFLINNMMLSGYPGKARLEEVVRAALERNKPQRH